MQNFRRLACGQNRICAHAGNPKAQNLDRAVPLHHHLRGLKAVVHDFVYMRMIQSLTSLARDVLQVPNRKPLFARQHGGNAVALHIFHGGAQLTVDISCSVKQRNIVATERFAGFCFLVDTLHQRFRLISQQLQIDCLQRDSVPTLAIRSFIGTADFGTRDFVDDFETADFIRHFFPTLVLA